MNVNNLFHKILKMFPVKEDKAVLPVHVSLLLVVSIV